MLKNSSCSSYLKKVILVMIIPSIHYLYLCLVSLLLREQVRFVSFDITDMDHSGIVQSPHPYVFPASHLIVFAVPQKWVAQS